MASDENLSKSALVSDAIDKDRRAKKRVITTEHNRSIEVLGRTSTLEHPARLSGCNRHGWRQELGKLRRPKLMPVGLSHRSVGLDHHPHRPIETVNRLKAQMGV